MVALQNMAATGSQEVFEVCPLLLPRDSSLRCYEGYISACVSVESIVLLYGVYFFLICPEKVLF